MTPRLHEKILYVLDLIFDARELTRDRDYILIEYDSRAEKIMSAYEFENIIKKIASEEFIYEYDEAINMLRPFGEKIFRISTIYDEFDDYYKNFKKKGKKQLGEEKNVAQYPDLNDPKIKTSTLLDENELLYELKYHAMYCQISINGKLLSNPHYGSINSVVFEYLFDHPNKDVSYDELKGIVEANINKILNKPLKKIAHELGFVGERKKLFFITSKDSARLITSITRKQIKVLNIDTSKIIPE